MRVYKCINLLFTQEHEYSISSDNAIEHALRHIHENIHKKLTLQELAGLVHLNPWMGPVCFRRVCIIKSNRVSEIVANQKIFYRYGIKGPFFR